MALENPKILELDIFFPHKSEAWFIQHGSVILGNGQKVYLLNTGKYKIGNGTTSLSALPLWGGATSSAFADITGSPTDNAALVSHLTTTYYPLVGNPSSFLVSADLAPYELITNKGAANGYASLDGGGKVPSSQLPANVMQYQGQYNATTGLPLLVDGVGSAGDVYEVIVAGTQNFGAGAITFNIGDWVVYNGTVWEKSTNSNEVVSVNGYTGAVNLIAHDLLLTGYVSGAGVVAATDTIRQAIEKLNGNIAAAVPTLSATHIGFGSGANLLTGSASLTWNDGTKVMQIASGTINLATNSNMTITGTNSTVRLAISSTTSNAIQSQATSGVAGDFIANGVVLQARYGAVLGSSVRDMFIFGSAAGAANATGAGMATLYQMRNVASTLIDSGRLANVMTNATAGAEQTAFEFSMVNNGSALTRFARLGVDGTLGMWWLGSAAPSSTNYTIGSNGTTAVVNAPSNVSLRANGNNVIDVNATYVDFVVPSNSPTVAQVFNFRPPTTTGATAGQNMIAFHLNYNNNIQHATGAIATQTDTYITARTHTAIGASVITDAATLAISGAPIASTNITITNPYALWVQTGAVKIGNNVVALAGDKLTITTTGVSTNTVGISNTATAGFMSIVMSESGSLYGGYNRYNSTFAGNYTGSSIPFADSFQLQSGNGNNKPIVFSGTPIYATVGTTGTNIGFRLDAVGLKIGELSTLHTATSANSHLEVVGIKFQAGGFMYGGAGNQSFVTLNATVGQIGCFSTYEAYAQTSITTRLNGTIVRTLSAGIMTFTPTVATSGAASVFQFVTPASTAQTASAETFGMEIDLTSTIQHATGAIATNRDVVIKHRTHSAVAASVITTAATVAITNAPAAGSNVTITNPLAFWVQAGMTRLATLTVDDLTATRLVFTSTGGKLVDNANLTYDAATSLLTSPNTYLNGYLNLKNSVAGGAIALGSEIVYVYTGAAPVNWTLPALASSINRLYILKNRGTGVVTLTAGADNLYTASSTGSITINPGESWTIYNDGSYWLCID